MTESAKERILALRAATGAPFTECRKALQAAGGEVERARELLVERGHALAVAKAERAVPQGTVGVYVHGEGKAAALVLLRCETDFVAQNPAFQELAKDLAMQVVAMRPLVVRPDEVPAGSRTEDAALLAQPWIKDPTGKQTVADVVASRVLELGENIVIERFSQFAV